MTALYRDPDQAPSADGGMVVLASDGDRDGAALVLNAAFAEGRLTAGEHGERVRAAYTARTWGELGELTADLPGPVPAAGPGAAGMPDSLDWCLMCALLVCCPPAGIAWLLAAWRRARAARRRTVAADRPSSGWAGITAGAGAGRRAEDR